MGLSYDKRCRMCSRCGRNLCFVRWLLSFREADVGARVLGFSNVRVDTSSLIKMLYTKRCEHSAVNKAL
jgi:hypothetical protein